MLLDTFKYLFTFKCFKSLQLVLILNVIYTYFALIGRQSKLRIQTHVDFGMVNHTHCSPLGDFKPMQNQKK